MKTSALLRLRRFGHETLAIILKVMQLAIAYARNQAAKLAEYIKVALNLLRDVSLRSFQRFKIFVIGQITIALNLLNNLWLLWTRELASKLIFYLVGVVLVLLLGIVVVGLVEYYRSTPSSNLLTELIRIGQTVSIQALALAALAVFSLWVLLGFVARQTLVVLVFTQTWARRPVDYVLKLLGSLPTLILGNAILVLANTIGFHPQGSVARVFFVIATLTIIGLPTVLQIGHEVLKDYDRRQLQQAIALGINRMIIGRQIVLPSIRRSFNAATVIAVSRIIIEGYIVLDRTFLASYGNSTIIRDSQDILDIFYGVYSTMTIQSNVMLILLLFFVAMLVNFSVFSLTRIQNP